MSSGISAVKPSVNAWNADYLDAQYAAFKADPGSIAPDMRSFFEGFDLALATGTGKGAAAAPAGVTGDGGQVHFEFAVRGLVDAYRRLGHLAADLDPFGNPRGWRDRTEPPAELSLAFHGLSEKDLSRACSPGIKALGAGGVTLGQVVELLQAVYTSTMGAEIMQVTEASERAFLIERIERGRGAVELSAADRTRILEVLINCEQFEKFVHVRYQGKKRFSVEGGESSVVALEACVEALAAGGVQECVLGMAHRGRLNVLHNIVGMGFEQLFTDFEESWTDDFAHDGGDVKYHRGYSADRTLRSGKSMRVSMSSNPSHLEAVDPIVLGRVRGKQRLRGDNERKSVAAILIHGDAAVIGQGSVAELINMAGLQGYTAGGSVHVVTNNMLGFTTLPVDGRTSEYCTDGAKMTSCPVLHINGEDPDACVRGAIIAAEYRQKFGKDIWVDVWCYRKYGHNETDEPRFTQPVMYETIGEKSKNAPVAQEYAQKLIGEGVVTESWVKEFQGKLAKELDAAQAAAQAQPRSPGVPPGGGLWKGIKQDYTFDQPKTGVSEAMLREVCATFEKLPEGFAAHRVIAKVLADRAALPTTKKLTYADGETLAYGTLLLEGHGVRLSGQDSRRGTFGHRHAVVRDQKTSAPYMPLNEMRPIAGKPGDTSKNQQGELCVWDSPLSELAVMSFDYGVSLTDPNQLVCWEGQFGDFCNGAQMLIDQFISSGEIKWERWSSLVLLLPHGQEGMGPEHSSCRPERFLQLCGNDNMQVVWPSTGAQAFHMLRRQMKAQYRKPLIVMTPKSQLRLQTSTLDELVTGKFQTVIDDPRYAEAKTSDRKGVKRVVLCSGKIYHELALKRDESKRGDTALVRLEQVYPFDAARLKEVLSAYPSAAQVVWTQEEPRNQGGYLFVADVMRQTLGVELAYVGRAQHATPASGSDYRTKNTQKALLASVIEWSEPAPLRGPGATGTVVAATSKQESSANGAVQGHAPGTNGTVAPASGAKPGADKPAPAPPAPSAPSKSGKR